ncbi:MAG: hypothetical protein Q9217_004727 [Psora testacea]
MAPLSKAIFLLALATTAIAAKPQDRLHKSVARTGNIPFPTSKNTLPYLPTGMSTGFYPIPTGGNGGPGNGGPGNGGPGNGGNNGENCPPASTVTVDETYTVTVTVGGADQSSPPYPSEGNGGGSPTGTGTVPIGEPSAYAGPIKRFQMKGLEKAKKEKRSWF